MEVAHEALLRKWERLANWIEQKQDDLRLLRQVKLAAADWDQKSQGDAFRWPDDRLKWVYAMIRRLELDEEHAFAQTEREFIRGGSDRLLEEIKNPDTPHLRRSQIGERLGALEDPGPGVGLRPDGLPDIDWCKVELEGKSSVEVEVEKDRSGKVKVDLPFYIARYPVTYIQFQSFIEALDGYHRRKRDWFEGLGADDSDKQLAEQRFKFLNHPRETVNWYQAMAFCRWLSWRFEALKVPLSGSELKPIDLMNPSTQMSRPKAGKARGFDLRNPFTWAVRPWGNDWDVRHANTYENGLARTTAVGMYPAGAASCGALDLIGNVWEWTLTENSGGKTGDVANKQPRVVRGGSWNCSQGFARAASRDYGSPGLRDSGIGFRLVGVVPSL